MMPLESLYMYVDTISIAKQSDDVLLGFIGGCSPYQFHILSLFFSLSL